MTRGPARRGWARLAGGDGLWRRLDRGLDRVYLACGGLAAVFVVAIAGLVTFSIVSRALGIYVPGTTEGAGYCMAAAGSLGLAWTFGTQGHVRVELLLERLGGRARAALGLWGLAAAIALTGLLVWYLVRMVRLSWDYGDLSDGSDALPLWIPQLPVAAGFALFLVSLVHALARAALGRRRES